VLWRQTDSRQSLIPARDGGSAPGSVTSQFQRKNAALAKLRLTRIPFSPLHHPSQVKSNNNYIDQCKKYAADRDSK